MKIKILVGIIILLLSTAGGWIIGSYLNLPLWATVLIMVILIWLTIKLAKDEDYASSYGHEANVRKRTRNKNWVLFLGFILVVGGYFSSESIMIAGVVLVFISLFMKSKPN